MLQTLIEKNATPDISGVDFFGTQMAHLLMSWPTTFKFSIRNEARFKGKLMPIRLVVNLPKRKRIKISINLKVEFKDWDPKKERMRGSSQMARIFNSVIERQRYKVVKLLSDYDARGIIPVPELFLADFKNESSGLSFIDFARNELKQERAILAASTYRKINSSLNVLQEFRPSLSFNEINDTLLEDFDRWQKAKGNLPNTRAKNFSQLRKYVNVAIRKHYLRENPFIYFKVKGGPSDRQALTPEQVGRLIDLYFNPDLNDTLKNVLQYFLASIFTGLRYGDIAQLNRSQIVERSLVIVPQKTAHLSKVLRIDLPELFFKIVNAKGQLFNRVLSNQKTNNALKAIQLAAGIPTNLTFHVARHTFACLYLFMGGKVEELRVLMGHSDIKTTMIYIHITEAWTSRGMSRFDEFFDVFFSRQ